MCRGRRLRASINCEGEKAGQFEGEVNKNKIKGRVETDVKSFGPLACNDFGFDFAEAKKDAAAVTIDGLNFLIVERICVVEGDHIPS